MFGMGPAELGIIAVIALVIFGPRQLPKLGKALGETITSMRQVGKEIEKASEDDD